eukprot:4938075-Heterocapsa_arctica.AAC.1
MLRPSSRINVRGVKASTPQSNELVCMSGYDNISADAPYLFYLGRLHNHVIEHIRHFELTQQVQFSSSSNSSSSSDTSVSSDAAMDGHPARRPTFNAPASRRTRVLPLIH